MKYAVEVMDTARVKNGRLFSDEFENDPWVLFHGTSQSNSHAIETHGFTRDGRRPTDADVKKVIGVFERMRWYGNRTGGFGVLKSFTSGDLSVAGIDPIFFTERSTRALRYATAEFAGGEKLRGIRLAILCLQDYLDNDETRERHMTSLRTQFEMLTSLNAAHAVLETVRPIPVDLNWLNDEVRSLQQLAELAKFAHSGFAGGVVYGVRMNEQDIQNLHYDATMGVKAFTPIPPDRIACKMAIAPRYCLDDGAIKLDVDAHFARMNSGVVGRLREFSIAIRS